MSVDLDFMFFIFGDFPIIVVFVDLLKYGGSSHRVEQMSAIDLNSTKTESAPGARADLYLLFKPITGTN